MNKIELIDQFKYLPVNAIVNLPVVRSYLPEGVVVMLGALPGDITPANFSASLLAQMVSQVLEAKISDLPPAMCSWLARTLGGETETELDPTKKVAELISPLELVQRVIMSENRGGSVSDTPTEVLTVCPNCKIVHTVQLKL